MNPAYITAEYFVEIITNSPDLCIFYEDLNTTIYKSIPSKIVSYLTDEYKGNLSYFFQKFSDVFLLREHSVTVTDSFQCINSNRPARYKKGCLFTNPIEKAAVDYFKLVLRNVSSWHFMKLFNMMLSEGDQYLIQYFSRYTASDMSRFFYMYSDIFKISNDMVSLNSEPYLGIKNSYLSEQDYSKLIQDLSYPVFFLLASFESLHYLELKQVISYVMDDIKDKLNCLCLIKQRELFQSISNITMDNKGFLRLNNFRVPVIECRITKLILLTVCILAFEQELHFEHLIKIIIDRSSLDINSFFRESSISQQFQFFRNYSNFFLIYDNGYVKLHSFFSFPSCVFKNSSVQIPSLQMPKIDLKLNTSLVVNNVSQINSSRSPQNKVQKPSPESINSVQPESINNKTNVSQGVGDIAEDQHSTNKVSKNVGIISNKVKHSILYLLKQYGTLNVNYLLKTLLYVLKDDQKIFDTLSSDDKLNFLRECCQYLSSELQKGISNANPVLDIYQKEKILLFITYMLIKNTSVHFEKLAKAIIEGKIGSPLKTLSKSSQFKYFKSMSDYLTVPGSGYITLNNSSFQPLNSLVDSYRDLFSEFQSLSNHKISETNKVNNVPKEKKISSNSSSNTSRDTTVQNRSVSEYSGFSSTSQNVTNTSKLSSSHTKEPDDIYNRTNYSILFLQKYFDPVVSKHVLETILYSLLDVNIYFCNLSAQEQLQFLEKCFQFVNSKTVNETLPLYQNLSKNLKDLEINVLFATYLLITPKMLHYQKIIQSFKENMIESSLCNKSDAEQLQYFKTLNRYFMVQDDGHICLQSRFLYLSSILDLIAAHIPKITSKCRTKVENCNNTVTDTNVINIIADLCFSILSSCEKMTIEKLCHQVNSCKIKSVQNFFSFFTISEKINFFKNIPEYFEVSKDGFVNLRRGVTESYVRKTNINISDLLLNNCSLSESTTDNRVLSNRSKSKSSSRCDSVRSSDVSEISETHSLDYLSDAVKENMKKGKRKRPSRSVRKKQQQQNFFCKNSKSPNLRHNLKEKENASQSAKDTIISQIMSNSCAKLNDNHISDFPNSSKTEYSSSFRSPDSDTRPNTQIFVNKSLKQEKNSKSDVSHATSGITENDSKNCTTPKNVKCDTFSSPDIDSKSALPCNEIKKSVCDIKVLEIHSISRYSKKNDVKLISVKSHLESDRDKIEDNQSANTEHLQNRSLSFQEGTEINSSTKEIQLSSISEATVTLSIGESKIRNSTIVSSPSTINFNLDCEKVKNRSCSKTQVPRQPLEIHKNSSKQSESSVVLSAGNLNSTVCSNTRKFTNNLEFSSSNIQLLKEKNLTDQQLNCNMSKLKTSNEKLVNVDCMEPVKLNEIVDLTAANSSLHDDFNFEELHDSVFSKSYGIELINSILGELKLDNSKVVGSSNDQTTEYQDTQMLVKLDNSSNCSKQETFEDPVNELRAVNFFCTMLRKYNSGVSAVFLRKLLSLASSEVQSFVSKHFGQDILPLFFKHKKIFYVSPHSKNIYLTKKLFCVNESKIL